MVETFEGEGIRFRFPENWRLEREDNETGWTVVLQSPDTAFAMISLNEESPSIESTAEAALAAMREDYPDLEADPCTDSLAGRPAVGHDIRFFSFDLTNTCWIRSFYCSRGTVVVMCQVNDLELDKNEPVLRAICASLEVEDE
jgi:hypothetical protein